MNKNVVALVLLALLAIPVFGQKALKNSEFAIVSVYEPPQSDVLRTALQLHTAQTDVARKLTDMKNMGLIAEISAASTAKAEFRQLISPNFTTAAEVLNAAASQGWILHSAYSQDVQGFPMHVFVLYRKKKKK